MKRRMVTALTWSWLVFLEETREVQGQLLVYPELSMPAFATLVNAIENKPRSSHRAQISILCLSARCAQDPYMDEILIGFSASVRPVVLKQQSLTD